MKSIEKHWTKEKLKTYILLLCAKADQVEAEAELNLIKSKIPAAIFEAVYQEFSKDTEDESLEKIQYALERHEYSNKELAALKKEIQEVFSTDNSVNMKERNLGWILDNILY